MTQIEEDKIEADKGDAPRDARTYAIIGAATSGLQKSLLINFGAQRLEYKRLVLNLHLSAPSSSASSADNPSLSQPHAPAAEPAQ